MTTRNSAAGRTLSETRSFQLVRGISRRVRFLVSAEAEVEREGVAELQKAEVRVQVPRLDGGGPFGIAFDAIHEELLQDMLFGNELLGFFQLSTVG